MKLGNIFAITVIVWLVVVGLFGYVAYHFISKFW
jgi:hypothetical protein